MRTHRGRTKKLIVAFHFQFSNQAAWKCDTCRAQGLEEKRRCGWTNGPGEKPVRIVWARRAARATVCPKSYITPDSMELLERFLAARRFGYGDVMDLPARAVDAFCVLEKEMAAEERDASE